MPCAKAELIASTVSRPTGMPIETTNAPPALKAERREKVSGLSILVMVASFNPSSLLHA